MSRLDDIIQENYAVELLSSDGNINHHDAPIEPAKLEIKNLFLLIIKKHHTKTNMRKAIAEL